jgi:hypothetical protein
MFANVNNYEMKMPKRYVELSEEEMEYDGGIFGIVLSLVGLGLSVAAAATGNKTLSTISNVVTVAGAITSFGISAPLAVVGKQMTVAVTKQVVSGATKTSVSLVKNNVDAAGNYLAGAGLDVGSTIVGVATW